MRFSVVSDVLHLTQQNNFLWKINRYIGLLKKSFVIKVKNKSTQEDNCEMVAFLISLAISLIIALFFGSKRNIGFLWSFFFCAIFSFGFTVMSGILFFVWSLFFFQVIPAAIFGLLITLASSKNNKELSPSITKKRIGWVLLFLGVSGISSLFKVIGGYGKEIGIEVPWQGLNLVFLTVGFLGTGYYLIKTGKGSVNALSNFAYCKYCNLRVAISQNEFNNKKFICPKCYEENNIDSEIDQIDLNKKEFKREELQIAKRRIIIKYSLIYALIGFIIGILIPIIIWGSNIRYEFIIFTIPWGYLIGIIIGKSKVDSIYKLSDTEISETILFKL